MRNCINLAKIHLHLFYTIHQPASASASRHPPQRRPRLAPALHLQNLNLTTPSPSLTSHHHRPSSMSPPPALRHQVIAIYKGTPHTLLPHSPFINTKPARTPVLGARVPPRVRLLSSASAQGLYGALGRDGRGQDPAGHKAGGICKKGYVFFFWPRRLSFVKGIGVAQLDGANCV